jgi:hypothetical protein
MLDGDEKKSAAEFGKKQAGTTLLTSSMYDIDFLNDQNEYLNYGFVNEGSVECAQGVDMWIEHAGKLPRD